MKTVVQMVAAAAQRAAKLFACSGTRDGDLAAQILEELAHELEKENDEDTTAPEAFAGREEET